MSAHTTWTAPGMDMVSAVAAAIRRAQAGDPLRVVRVLTPDAATNDTLRRTLPLAGGVCGAEVSGVLRLARQLASSRLGERRMASSIAVLAAVQQVLSGPHCPAPLKPVAEHPATHDALVDAVASLAGAFVLGADAPSSLRELAGRRTSARAVVDAVIEVRRVLGERDWVDQAELLSTAVDALTDHPQPALVVVVTAQFNPAFVPFVRHLIDASPAEIIAVAMADPLLSTAAHVARLIGEQPPIEPPVASGPTPLVVSCPDHDEEAREVARRIIRLLNQGVAADRIAVYYPAAGPHQSSLGATLRAAGVPVRGHVRPMLAGSLAGQLLRTMLDAFETGIDRPTVLRVARLAPFGWYLDEAREERATRRAVTRWTRQCRRLGIVGSSDWDEWQPVGATEEGEETALQLTLDLAGPAPARRDPQSAQERLDGDLWRFVQRQMWSLGGVLTAPTWADLAQRLGDWLRQHTGTPEWRLATWKGAPAWQHEAAEQVEALVVELANLDDVGLALRPRFAARLLRAALHNDVNTAESKGVGVLVAQTVDAVGGAADHVFVVGANQGLLPGPVSDDLVITAGHGDEPLGVLSGPAGRPRRDERGRDAALAGAAESVTVTWSRYDVRNGGEMFPAAFIDPTSAADRSAGWPRHEVASHASALLAADDAWLDTAEWFAADEARRHPELQRRRRAITARLQHAPGEYDGQVGSLAGAGRANPFLQTVADEDTGRPVERPRPLGITKLESMIVCGMSMLFDRVLGAGPHDPDAMELADIEPRERGTAIHGVIDRLAQEWLDAHPEADGLQPWIPDEVVLGQRVARAEQLFDEVNHEVVARHRVGHPEMWTARRAAMLAALGAYLRREMDELVCPVRSEYAFGYDDPLVWSCEHGEVALLGKVDRINRVGGRLQVVDYKSGRGTRQQSIRDDQPLGAQQQHLQLPLYGWAVGRTLGEQVDVAGYRFIDTSMPKPIDLQLSGEVITLFSARLSEIVGDVTAGRFRPGDVDERYPCEVCCPDGLGVDDVNQRRLVWQRHEPERGVCCSAGENNDG